jgi:hypothetical protein
MLEWPLKGFRSAWIELERQHMVRADWASRLIWIPNAVRHNPPESPNVVRSWRPSVDDLPECALKTEALVVLRKACEGLGEAFVKAFDEAFPGISDRASPKLWPNQEQDQEQEQEFRSASGLPEGLPESPPEQVAVHQARFERFIAAYPIREHTQSAWDAWCALGPPSEPSACQIVAGAEQYAVSARVRHALERGETQFIKSPANWLKEAMWMDQPVTVAARAAPKGCRHQPRCMDAVACTARMTVERNSEPISVSA